MSETPERKPSESDAPGSVFGNLPDARPGTRSPRRKADAKAPARAKKSDTKAAKPARAKSAKPAPAEPARQAPPPPQHRDERPAAAEQPGGLADVAWAGIAVAAEAATIGVRLASRAIDAVRGNSERD